MDAPNAGSAHLSASQTYARYTSTRSLSRMTDSQYPQNAAGGPAKVPTACQ